MAPGSALCPQQALRVYSVNSPPTVGSTGCSSPSVVVPSGFLLSNSHCNDPKCSHSISGLCVSYTYHTRKPCCITQYRELSQSTQTPTCTPVSYAQELRAGLRMVGETQTEGLRERVLTATRFCLCCLNKRTLKTRRGVTSQSHTRIHLV